MIRDRITSREDLIDFCLRQNGAPVIQINVDQEQVEDLVDLTLSMYYDFHMEGTERTYFPYTITLDDLNNQYITLPKDVISVLKLFELNSVYSKNIAYQAYITDIINQVNTGGASSYLITQQHLNTISSIFNREKSVRFNKNNFKLFIDTDWGNIKEGDSLMIECFRIIDPEEFVEVYSDRWVIQYLTQLIKRQWANNLKKYAGTTLPGGVTLDAQTWFSEAQAEIDKLEIQLREWYEMPVMGCIG